ncbi:MULTISPECIES: DUF4351 domain-containing protein [unclassified Duganella]|uniref:DUF4351 domain-containing protein n=1 Tax=unclassified Duganella TaxID=2636909 RepID=UPI000B7E6A3C|nr:MULTISPECIES: DUF4351 domain-containing protein [unclassified Duganella]
MSFFFAELGAGIDWSHRPLFRDKELAGLNVGGPPDGLVADLLAEVCVLGDHARMLIHIEVQTRRDAAFARRVFDYNYRIDRQHARPVASLVVLADNDPRWRPTAYHRKIKGTMTMFYFSAAKLLDYANRTDELMISHNPFALITLAHLRTQQAGHDADQLYAAKWQLTKRLYQHRWRKKRIIEIFKVINWMMALPAAHQQRYWHAVLKLEQERKMEWISPLEQSFMDKGWTQGRKEGAMEMLERQLTKRFGPLPKTIQNKLKKASLDRLWIWSDKLQEAESLKHVFE